MKKNRTIIDKPSNMMILGEDLICSIEKEKMGISESFLLKLTVNNYSETGYSVRRPFFELLHKEGFVFDLQELKIVEYGSYYDTTETRNEKIATLTYKDESGSSQTIDVRGDVTHNVTIYSGDKSIYTKIVFYQTFKNLEMVKDMLKYLRKIADESSRQNYQTKDFIQLYEDDKPFRYEFDLKKWVLFPFLGGLGAALLVLIIDETLYAMTGAEDAFTKVGRESPLSTVAGIISFLALFLPSIIFAIRQTMHLAKHKHLLPTSLDD